MERDDEGRGARSYSIKNDTNKYIHSDDDDYNYNNNDNIGEEEEDDNKKQHDHKSQAWGTWEELLLACAVKRHGFTDWDSVATEVRSRSSNSAVFVSASDCKQKYRDLKRRFHADAAVDTAATTEEERIGNNIPWLEQLRSLRVAELRREVQRYDVSILSLQLKVKRLEEEREGDEKPDLEDERKVERSESEHREKAVSTAEESDRENRSMNESNSTASGGKTAGEDDRVGGNEPSRDESGDNNNPDPDPVYKAEDEEGSEASHSDELGESGTSGRKWKRKRRKHSEINHGGSGEEIRSAASKSQPLIGLLDLIRSHPRGSLFERRLRSQETKDYKSLVKQHLDIEIIQRKLKKGLYDSSSICFYRDLHLLFTNAIVFFPSSSSESMAAHELRTVVSKKMRKETGKSGPRLINHEASSAMINSVKADAETLDSSLSRHKSLAPLVVCKKRKTVSAKASPSSSSFSQKEETKEEVLSEEKENTVTGVRSSRRTGKVVASAATKTGKGKNKQKQTESKTNSSNDNNHNSSKQETGKTEKKMVSSDKKKSVADFLKRLKKNSPQKEDKDQNKSKGNGKKESKTKPRELRSNSVGKKKAEVENTPVKRAPGRPQKKTAEASATATASASGKRGRESGSTGKDNKQPKKKSRR